MNPPLQHWAQKRVWIIGASSGIGRATASALHALGAQVTVSARNAHSLDAFVQAHPGSRAQSLDVQSHASWQIACAADQDWDLVVYCAGTYQALRAQAFGQDAAQAAQQMQTHMDVNYLGAVRLLQHLLPRLLRQGQGHVCLVSSVAGFRALPKSLAYGPTKAALTHLAEGLYLDLAPKGIGVSVVHPGFVATPLTAQNDFSMPALLQPEQAAQCLIQAWQKGQFHIHFPRRFTRWLQLLRLMPYRWAFALTRRATGL